MVLNNTGSTWWNGTSYQPFSLISLGPSQDIEDKTYLDKTAPSEIQSCRHIFGSKQLDQ